MKSYVALVNLWILVLVVPNIRTTDKTLHMQGLIFFQEKIC